jgi:hypothetical protein
MTTEAEEQADSADSSPGLDELAGGRRFKGARYRRPRSIDGDTISGRDHIAQSVSIAPWYQRTKPTPPPKLSCLTFAVWGSKSAPHF